jgi:hypothetical protein
MFRYVSFSPVALLLAVGLVILLVVWLRTRDRRAALGLGVLAAVCLLIALWKLLGPESPTAQIQRKLQEMTGAVEQKRVDLMAQHVSDDFDYAGIDKPAMQRFIQQFVDRGELTDIKIWEWDREPIDFAPAKDGKKPTAKIAFKTKPVGSEVPQEPFFRCVAEFVQDADNQWRLKTFELFTQPGNQPLRVPQLPGR